MFFLYQQPFCGSLTICLCTLAVGLIQYPRLQKLINTQETPSLETLEKEIKVENTSLSLLKKMPSFGYDNLMADFVYLKFLQYFGDDDVREKTGYSLSPEYFEIILARDPRFLEAYLSLSTSTSLYAAMPERAIKLMDQGLKSLSPQVPEKSYYAWRYKGIDELLFLGDAQSSKQSFETAAKWASTYSDEESKYFAAISQKTVDFLNRNPDSKHARIATWAMVLNNKVDERTRKRAINAIEALGGKVITTPQGNSQILFPPQD
jgi:hypothetical protein